MPFGGITCVSCVFSDLETHVVVKLSVAILEQRKPAAAPRGQGWVGSCNGLVVMVFPPNKQFRRS